MADWNELTEAIQNCNRCILRQGCTNVVPGEGNPNADIMFIGEGPGQEEDRTGRPFVGKAGELLTKMIAAIGMQREDVYICNTVKCRPPANRTPMPEEMLACKPYLREQFKLVRPKIIVLLGAAAGKDILGEQFRVTRDRGKWVERKGVWFMPTYHPSALLRNELLKRPAWEDFKAVLAKYNELKENQNGNDNDASKAE